MTLAAYSGMMQAIAMRYDYQFGMQQANQAQMGMANRVTGMETPAQLATLNQSDKQLTLGNLKSALMLKFAAAMEEQTRKQLQDDFDRKKQSIQNGWLA